MIKPSLTIFPFFYEMNPPVKEPTEILPKNSLLKKNFKEQAVNNFNPRRAEVEKSFLRETKKRSITPQKFKKDIYQRFMEMDQRKKDKIARSRLKVFPF